jgi:hypothetical protein
MKVAEFNAAWLLLLLFGLLLFHELPGFVDETLGQVALLLYLIFTIHHTIQGFPSIVEAFRIVRNDHKVGREHRREYFKEAPLQMERS